MEREVQMTELIAVEEWEEFVGCLQLGLRLKSGVQMRDVCTAEILDLKVGDIVSCFLPQDFAAHVSGAVGVLNPDVMELIRDKKALPLFCTLRRLGDNGRLPLSTRRQHTYLKELLAQISQCSVRGATFYRKVALLLERAANDPLLRDNMYIPRSQQQSRAELFQLAS